MKRRGAGPRSEKQEMKSCLEKGVGISQVTGEGRLTSNREKTEISRGQ